MKTKLVAGAFTSALTLIIGAPVFAQFQGASSAGSYIGPSANNCVNSVAVILKKPVNEKIPIEIKGEVDTDFEQFS